MTSHSIEFNTLIHFLQKKYDALVNRTPRHGAIDPTFRGDYDALVHRGDTSGRYIGAIHRGDTSGRYIGAIHRGDTVHDPARAGGKRDPHGRVIMRGIYTRSKRAYKRANKRATSGST